MMDISNVNIDAKITEGVKEIIIKHPSGFESIILGYVARKDADAFILRLQGAIDYLDDEETKDLTSDQYKEFINKIREFIETTLEPTKSFIKNRFPDLNAELTEKIPYLKTNGVYTECEVLNLFCRSNDDIESILSLITTENEICRDMLGKYYDFCVKYPHVISFHNKARKLDGIFVNHTRIIKMLSIIKTTPPHVFSGFETFTEDYNNINTNNV